MPGSAWISGSAGAVIDLEDDVLAQQPAKHLGHVVDDFVQVQVLRLDDLAAAEREQLAGEIRRALGRQRDLLRGFLARPRSGCRVMPSREVWPWMTVRMLLKSCAMPPASCPTDSIFCACRNCASRFCRSVMSAA